MSWIKRFAVCAAAIGALAVSGATAMADCVRGDFVGWDSNDWMLEFNAGNYYALTVQATTNGSAMKFNNGSTWWGAGTSAVTNSSIGAAVSSSDSGNLALPVTSGQWYTFHVTGHGEWGTRQYLVMKTQYKPAVINTVTDTHATAFEEDVSVEVTCELSADTPRISDEEVFYLVYTADGWATQTRQVMTKSGITARGTIPGQTAGTTVNYYVFSSAMPTNLFTSEKIWSVNADGQSVEIEKFGFCMLAIANNGGSYAYTTAAEQTERVPGNVWHNPGAYEPFDSATMRDPETVREGDTPYIRLGSYPRVDSGSTDAPDLVYLWYRVNSGTWYHRTMGTATTSQDYANNDYFTNSLPTDKMVEGNVIEYIFEAAYANSGTLATTFVGTTNQTDSVVYTNKATAQANPFRFTVAAAPVVVLDPGNVWHIPASAEVNGKTMRDPVNPGEGNDVTLYLGNQSDYQDGWMTSANVKYRVGTSGAWTTLALGWESGAGGENSNNAFWTNAIPAVNEGQTVQYYFEALFANSTVLGTTYVYTTNNGTGCAKAMEEADAQASPFSYTATARVYNLGNCWHIPGQFEPWPKATMRNPCYPSAGDAICFFVGNQAHGDGGNPGNMTGGTLYHRASGASAWSTVALEHEADSENNKYWKAILPAGTYASAGDMEYYVEVTYSDHDTTYLGTDSGARSQTFATAAEAQQHLFTCPVGDTAGREPGYMWHAGNAVVAGTNAVQFWVKIGYTKDGTDWADTVQLRYNFKPVGTNGVPKDAVRTGRTAKKRMVRALSSYSTANFVRDHEEEDSSEHGNAVWWSCTLTDDNFMDSEQYLEYEIVAKNSRGNDTWRWADYRTGSATNQFYYTMFQPGSGALTVNGLNADYTTSKFFIDEAAGETVTLDVVYSPAYGTPYAVEIFSNVGRRDYWNADIDDNHIADSIFPPSGDLITSNTVGSYFAAIPMERESPTGPYKKTLTVGKTGAYRLTARYKETAGDFWHYYSDNGIRDHAIVISPKKVLQQRVYEINGMTAKASSPTEAGHSTFEDLIEGADSFAEFGIPYLNKIQANCLWFQPIHTSSEQGLMVGGEPGSPYAAKDYFSVSKWYGKEVNGQRTTAQALTEFQDFVAACDAGKSPSMSQSYVGTINIMLDGVFNHTSWDAVFGVMGETMGLVPAGQGANTPIARS